MDVDPFINQFNKNQSTILICRQIQLGVGCSVLLSIIILIIVKKQYVYNTTKLFMWCCVNYLIGMAVVLLHLQSYTRGIKFSYDQINPDSHYPYDSQHKFYEVLRIMKSHSLTWTLCGLEAFSNLFFYNVGYFFAILVTYNVNCVLADNYRNFMKRIVRTKILWVLLFVMLLVYLVPWVLMYVKWSDNDYIYSYGPAGFKINAYFQNEERNANLLLYCGIISNPDNLTYKVLSIVNYYISPTVMLVYHSLLLIYNRRKIGKFVIKSTYLNSKQLFLLKSGEISFIVFLIQFVNFFKFVLGFFLSSAYVFLLIINFFFDLYPFVLLFFYLRYTKEKQTADSLLYQEEVVQVDE